MNRFGTTGLFFCLLLTTLASVDAAESTPPPAAPPAAGQPMMGHGPMMGDGMMEQGGVTAGCAGDGEFSMRVPGPHGNMMWMNGMGDMGGMRMMHALASLDLTPEQNKQRELLMLAHRKEAIALSSQMQTADVELDELLLADPVALDKVKAKVKEKHDAAAKLEVSHIQLTQDVKKLLTPEQRKSLDAAMLEMKPMFQHRTMGQAMMAPAPLPN